MGSPSACTEGEYSFVVLWPLTACGQQLIAQQLGRIHEPVIQRDQPLLLGIPEDADQWVAGIDLLPDRRMHEREVDTRVNPDLIREGWNSNPHPSIIVLGVKTQTCHEHLNDARGTLGALGSLDDFPEGAIRDCAGFTVGRAGHEAHGFYRMRLHSFSHLLSQYCK